MTPSSSSRQGLRARVLFTALLLGTALLAVDSLNGAERVPTYTPLRQFPVEAGGWRGTDLPLDPSVLAMAGVHDYVNRAYIGPQDHRVELYVGYYPSQRTGDTIHSPKNCLPGAGWVPLHSGVVDLDVPGEATPIRVNDYVVAKGPAQAVVLYWFQGRGRVIASEYAAKFWMAADALRRHRTDGALVRVWVPIENSTAAAQRRAAAFTETIYPNLSRFIPN